MGENVQYISHASVVMSLHFRAVLMTLLVTDYMVVATVFTCT